ncbi:MAG TPA: hypothetical protein DIU00_09780 [Phycisphaerales bacterium]|nr:hypothetical protein [Phycisphaerales bacterium]
MLDVIQRSPKIYLDTRDLINIARVRKGNKPQPCGSEEDYLCIDECIKAYCGLIFNPYAALEWVEGNATKESASGIAAVVDSAQVKYMIDADYLVYTQEVLAQCHNQNPYIDVPDLPPVLQNISDKSTFRSALGILVRDVPDYLEKDRLEQIQRIGKFPITVPTFSAGDWTEKTFNWKQSNKGIYQERIDGFRDSLLRDIELKEEYFGDRERYRTDWLKRYLKIDRILMSLNQGIDVDVVLKDLDTENCCALKLCWAVREKRMESQKPPKDNDADDYMFLSIIHYSDLILMERELRDYILWADNSLESKVFSNPSDFLKALKEGFIW